MICLQLTNGALVPMPVQPPDISTCSMVVLTGQEYQTYGASPFNLTVSEGAQIGTGIFACCAIAWLFKVIGKTLTPTNPSFSDED